MKNIDINILQLAQGAVQEKLDREFEKVFENIQDPNVNATAKRTITLKIDLVPDDVRQVVKTNVTATSKLAPTDPVATTILTGKDLTTNKIEARELQSGVPGQTYIDEKGDLRTDTGEPVDVIEKETRKKSKVIDLQEKRG
ncbi:replication terminator protein [Ligilactobacillus salivarius]|uniref:replication terminator protein n=1 Tax=Ligilactobacillus salivarius TaxID=1624 RepID=UPI0034A4490F